MKDNEHQEIQVTAQITALQWDYRTDQARVCCEAAFGTYQGEGTQAGTILGVVQPVYIEKDRIVPVSTYDILVQGRFWISGCIMEEMKDQDFTSVSRAVLSSHLGNRDTMLQSQMDRMTANAWTRGMKINRIILKDLLIFTIDDIDTYLQDLRSCPVKYKAQKDLGFPELALIVLPPPKSQHDRFGQLRRVIQATEFIDKWTDSSTVSFNAPVSILKP